MTEPATSEAWPAPTGIDAVRLQAMRVAFKALERIAPGVGGRWAIRLWVTLPRTASSRRDDRPRAGARTTVALPGSRSVVVESWGDGAPVYLVHGWGGWRGQMGPFVEDIVEAGYRAVAFDGPSHGDSSPGHLGKGRSSMLELSATLRAVADAHGQPAGVIAHSGGAMATSAAIRDGLAVPRMVMIAPAADPNHLIDQLGEAVGFGPRIRAQVEERTTRIAGRPITDYDVRRLPSFAAVPATLVVHDRQDKEVRVTEAEQIADAWPDAKLHLTDGLGHRRIIRDRDVVRSAVAHVLDSSV